MLERWNTHFSTVVDVELFDIQLQLAQDPNSNNHGTTVWDSSIVLAKYIQYCRKGDFSRPKVRGKRVLELGAGMGLAGMAMALLGAEVTFTDIGDVLPLLQHNVQQNISPAALRLKDASWVATEVGPARVAALDWSDTACYASFQPPYDFVLAADCVYSELAVPHLLNTVLHMSGPRTQVVITNEFRSQAVHDIFMQQFNRHFTMRKVPAGKQDPNFQHPLIHIYLLKKRKQPLEEAEAEGQGVAAAAGGAAGGSDPQPAVGSTLEAAAGLAAVGSPAEAAEAAEEAEAAEAVGIAGAEGQQQQRQQGRAGSGGAAEEAAQQADPAAAVAGAAAPDAESELCDEERSICGGDGGGESSGSSREAQEFQTRRQGAMLAKALKDVKL